MVASKCGSKHTIFRFQKRGNQNSGNGEPVSHTLSHAVNVCVHTRTVRREKFTCSAIATFHFIRNKQGIVISTYRSYFFKKRIFSYVNSANPLYALYNHSGNFTTVVVKIFFESICIVERKEDDVFCLVNRRDDGGIIGNRYCQGGSAMKGFVECNDLFPTGMK